MDIRKTVKKIIPKNFFAKIEPLGHGVEAVVIGALHGFPARKLRVIGVTGTNGKTTTTFMIHRMLHEAGYKVGLMSTVAYGVGDDIKPQIEHMTTVSTPVLNKRMKAMIADGAEWLVLETSSHALAQNRVFGVPYEIAVMTNVTHEHLDYHGTFERYRDAKKKLFTMTNSRNGFGVINADDPSAELFAAAIGNSVTYGIKDGALRATKLKLTPAGSNYVAKIDDERYPVTCNIPGEFNVSNSLAAVSVGRHLGLTPEQIQKGIATLSHVEGRMTRIDEGQAFTVIVDYAHTPDSFEKLLSDLRTSTKGKLIVMFGSAGGRRDPAKRPIQGEIAGRYADEVVLTEEDDRDTDGMQILEEIANGAIGAGKQRDTDMFLVHDRSEAIAFSLTRATGVDDVVMLLGKGHEKSIERADGEYPWNETEEARKALRRLTKR